MWTILLCFKTAEGIGDPFLSPFHVVIQGVLLQYYYCRQKRFKYLLDCEVEWVKKGGEVKSHSYIFCLMGFICHRFVQQFEVKGK